MAEVHSNSETPPPPRARVYPDAQGILETRRAAAYACCASLLHAQDWRASSTLQYSPPKRAVRAKSAQMSMCLAVPEKLSNKSVRSSR